jgi:hypothetical protein
VRIDTAGAREATLASAGLATTFNAGTPLAVPAVLRRAAEILGDLLTLAAIVLCLPFVIVAIGTPIALCIRLVLWILGML